MSVHRWLGLAAGLLWLLQAATGAAIVFHWEEDDASIGAYRANTDFNAMGERLALLAPAGSGRHVTQVWTSAGLPDWYDALIVDNQTGAVTTVRVAGDGRPVRVTLPGHLSLINTIVLIHQSLLSGKIGRWIIGASGLLLLSNLLAGAFLAWPKRRKWARALKPPTTGGQLARYYGWHRALGLLGVAPALVLVSAGVLLAFDEPMANVLHIEQPSLPPRAGKPAVGFGEAVTTALRRLPNAKFAAAEFPVPQDATYRVHLRSPGEWRRAYGNSLVFVDAVTGRVRDVALARDEPTTLYWLNTLAPTHTGEAFGLFGRLLVLCTGLWLATMIFLGGRLWWLRR